MSQKQRLGRPRAGGKPGDGPVEEDILAAARVLFRAQGYSGTSTREIANAAGLRQPTLFHYFKNKAAIMEAIALRAMEPEIQFLQAEAKASHPPDVGLYRYARFVVFNLQTNANVIGSPQKFPELTREKFATFWQQYDRVRRTMYHYIRTGVRQGIFFHVDPKIASEQLFALVEYALTTNVSGTAAAKAADTAATLVLRALLLNPGRLESVQAAAQD